MRKGSLLSYQDSDAVDMAQLMVAGEVPEHPLQGGGPKGHQLDLKAQI